MCEAMNSAISGRSSMPSSWPQQPKNQGFTKPKNQSNRSKVFISYSHNDREYLDRLQVHLKPLEGKIDLWDDTKIKPGAKWKEEVEKALDSARVAVLLISADFVASDFIKNHELPRLLEAAENDGAIIIPLILKHSLFTRIQELAQFQAINDPSKPLVSLSESEQEKILVDLAKAIQDTFEGNGINQGEG